MAQVVLFLVSSGTEIWQRWYYSMAIYTEAIIFVIIYIFLHAH